MIFNTEVFEDTVLIKSDGYPTYHWACVIDDHEMGITHVIRGEDHLTNTPRQMLLIEAMGWRPPAYVHLPLILGSDGTPLSKRHGAVSVTHYREEGFLPEGMVNYLALLGWGPSGNQEFFTRDPLIEKFSLKKLIRSAARFDTEKLRWLNGRHLRNLPESDYLHLIQDFFKSDSLQQAALLFRSRIQTLKDLKEEASYFFQEVEAYDLEAMNRSLGTPGLREKLTDLRKALEAVVDFKEARKLEAILRDTAARHGVEAKALIHPLRLALTGKGVSPGLFELMKALGQETCLRRLNRLIEKLSP